MRRWLVLLSIPSLCAAVGLIGCGLRRSSPESSPGDSPASAAFQLVWTFEPVERGAIVSSPLVAGDRLYVSVIQDAGLSTSGTLYCLARASGQVLWKFDDDGRMQHMSSSPCLADGRVYVGEGMHQNHRCKLYCVDARSGRKCWDFTTGGHIESSPCVAEGKVFFGAGDEGVYGLDQVTGTECWHFGGPVHVDTSPTVVGGRLYAGSGTSRLHMTTAIFCLDAQTGTVRWQQATDLPAWGSPAVDGDEAFFGLGNGRLLKGPAPPATPAGALLCVDARTGRQHWRWSEGDAVFLKPAVDRRRVYFGARDGLCYGLDRHDGRLCWKLDLGSPIVARPALLGRHLFVVASGGRLCRIDADSGSVDRRLDLAAYTQLKPQIFSSPAVLPDPEEGGEHHLIYVGTELSNSVTSSAVLYCWRD